jgi:NifU-like protein involved in Fe-S cluster formation
MGLDDINKLLGIDFSTKPVRAKCAMLGLRATQEAIRRYAHEPAGEHS